MIAIKALAGRPIFQIAFVVADLEQALERYTALVGASPWRCWTLGATDHVETEYRGRPTSFSSRLALNNSSPQLELIQPLTGPSAHQDWLEQYGEGPHHIGIVVDSVPETITELTDAGYPLVHRGAGLGPHRDGAWAYFDTTDALGLMLEAVQPPTSMPPVELMWPSDAAAIHARSEVAGRSWPDVLESSARASLRNALSGVRRTLGPAADRVLISGRETVGLAGLATRDGFREHRGRALAALADLAALPRSHHRRHRRPPGSRRAV